MSMAVRSSSQSEIWNLIEESKRGVEEELPPPYVHPLLRRSSSFLSEKSLEVCTESLGSETGSDGYSDLEGRFLNSPESEFEDLKDEALENLDVSEEHVRGDVKKGLAAVNYHCSLNRQSPPRSFPPPLPSISRRDGPCFNMRTQRYDGRLVMQAVAVPSQNYLHCERQDGRLLLSFIETTFEEIYPEIDQDRPFVAQTQQAPEDEEEHNDEETGVLEVEEEVEEEVEVVDRGIVVEVKVSRQPQLLLNKGVKLHRSSLVINKFVSGVPMEPRDEVSVKFQEGVRHDLKGVNEMEMWGVKSRRSTREDVVENKMLFSSKGVVNRQELIHQVRRCSESQRHLFIWEPLCVATS